MRISFCFFYNLLMTGWRSHDDARMIAFSRKCASVVSSESQPSTTGEVAGSILEYVPVLTLPMRASLANRANAITIKMGMVMHRKHVLMT